MAQVSAGVRAAAAAALVNQANANAHVHQAVSCPNPTKHPQQAPVAAQPAAALPAPANGNATRPPAPYVSNLSEMMANYKARASNNTIRPPASIPADPTVLMEGTMLAGGRYMLGPLLGRGSFGITYRGFDQRLDRAIAIKEFFPEGAVRHAGAILAPASLGRQGYELERGHFIDEARVLAHFQRPGIVTVYEVFEENDTAYMVMEHIAGRTLVELLQERGKPLPPADALRYILAVADALAAVHEQHLLHRDVKPGNIMVTPDDRAVLIDFGAARRFDRHQRTSMMTAIGTPGYAPLEQWGSSGRFGPTSDVYALAATLYHLLTGQMPPSAADRATNETLIPPRELSRAVPAPVSEAVVHALSVRMDDRPQSMAAFAAALRSARNVRAQPAAPPAAPPGQPPAAVRRPAPSSVTPQRAQTRPESSPQPAPQPVGAIDGQEPRPQPQGRRRFPWPRRRRDRLFWAGGFIFVPAVLSASVFSLSVVVPLLALCAITPSWRLRRLSRRWFRRSSRLGLHGIGICTVSAVSLALVAALTARTVVRGALNVTGMSLRLIS